MLYNEKRSRGHRDVAIISTRYHNRYQLNILCTGDNVSFVAGQIVCTRSLH